MHNNDYDFTIIPLLKEGLRRSDGVKGSFLGALIVYMIIAIFVNGILEFIFPSEFSTINALISGLVSGIITVPVQVGITMLGVKRAREESFNVGDIFNYFSVAMPIVVTYILLTLMLTLGFVLLILPGIYLVISYSFAYQLVVDKGLGAWEAMELSRKTITAQWFKFFGLSLVLSLVVVVSAIPFGIGLIWTIPMAYISYGLLYHHLFDDERIAEDIIEEQQLND